MKSSKLPAHCRRSGRTGRGGFTLPELMAVVGILGILTTLASVSVNRNLRSDASSGLAHEVYTRLVQARFAATSGGMRVQVLLMPGQVPVALQLRTAVAPGVAPPPPNDGYGPYTDNINGRPISQIVGTAPTVDYTGTPPPVATAPTSITFYPDGRAQIDGLPPQPGVTIYLADDQLQYPRRIVVMGLTGFVRLVGG